MRIEVVCSSKDHPVIECLFDWADSRSVDHDIVIVNECDDLEGGHFLFLVSCTEVVSSEVRKMYEHALVVHASALPFGRGWSPHIWGIIEGKNEIPVTLIEAADEVDTGDIWGQEWITLEGHELYDEINAKVFEASLKLMDTAITGVDRIRPKPQANVAASYYRKRTPEDSKLDPHVTIARQFDLLRVADPDRFPCYFDFRGKRYTVILRKSKES